MPKGTPCLPIVVHAPDCFAGAVLYDSGHHPQWWQDPQSKLYDSLQQSVRTGANSPRLHDTRAALAFPLLHNGSFGGVLTIEYTHKDGFSRVALPDIPIAQPISVPAFAHTPLGHAVHDLATLLCSAEGKNTHTQLAEFSHWMDRVEQCLPVAQDPNRHRSFYDQILQVALRIPVATDLSGAILLLREEAQTILDPRWVDHPLTEAQKKYLIVVAHSIGGLVSPPDPQWPLINTKKGKFGSITGRVIDHAESEIVSQVSKDPDYISSGTYFDKGSELNCILQPGESHIGIIGTIALLSPNPDAFTKLDKERVDNFCQRAALIIWRNSQVSKFRRSSHQLRFGRRLIRELETSLNERAPNVDPRATLEERLAISLSDFESIRKGVRGQILEEAKKQTGADFGVIAQIRNHDNNTYCDVL